MRMTSKNNKIIVLGSGVIGLTSAILLQESGYKVEIWSSKVTPDTTSDVAAAFWLPFNAEPIDKVLEWSKETFEFTRAHLINVENSGCMIIPFSQLTMTGPKKPWWESIVPQLQTVTDGLPDSYSYAFEFSTVLFDSSVYMKYLIHKFLRNDGVLINKEIESISDLPAGLSVNCLGLGAKSIFSDLELYPVRGQVLVVEKNGFEKIILDPEHEMLIVPRTNDIIIGATVQKNDDDLSIRKSDTDRMLGSVVKLYPDFEWKLIGEKVGLRPARSSIRLEREIIGDKTVIHNYGHGGSGYTVSWGCAMDVVNLARAR